MWLLQVFWVIFAQADPVCATSGLCAVGWHDHGVSVFVWMFLPAPAGSLRGRGLLAVACSCLPSSSCWRWAAVGAVTCWKWIREPGGQSFNLYSAAVPSKSGFKAFWLLTTVALAHLNEMKPVFAAVRKDTYWIFFMSYWLHGIIMSHGLIPLLSMLSVIKSFLIDYVI